MIQQAITTTFYVDRLEQMRSDEFRMALYDKSAELGFETMAYTPKGEVKARGYAAGGKVLTGARLIRSGERGVAITWDSPVWPDSEIKAHGAMIYNATRGHIAIAVLDFQKEVTSTDAEFTVHIPPAGVLGF